MKPITQREIGHLFGISQSRVKQLEARAIAKLRAAIIAEAESKGETVRQWLLEAA